MNEQIKNPNDIIFYIHLSYIHYSWVHLSTLLRLNNFIYPNVQPQSIINFILSWIYDIYRERESVEEVKVKEEVLQQQQPWNNNKHNVSSNNNTYNTKSEPTILIKRKCMRGWLRVLQKGRKNNKTMKALLSFIACFSMNLLHFSPLIYC